MSACGTRLTSPSVQALVAAQQRNFELEGLLHEAQTKIGCAAKHRKSAQKQLDAQEQDFERLGQRLKVPTFSAPLCAFQPCFHGVPSRIYGPCFPHPKARSCTPSNSHFVGCYIGQQIPLRSPKEYSGYGHLHAYNVTQYL